MSGIIPRDHRVYLVRDLRYPPDDRLVEPARFIESSGPRGSYWQFFGTDDDVYATEGVEVVAEMVAVFPEVAMQTDEWFRRTPCAFDWCGQPGKGRCDRHGGA